MQTKKSTLYTIIILLVIFLPPAIYGTIKNINFKKEEILDNPNKDFFYNGTLYFYNTDGNLVGTYECKNKNIDNCGYVKTIIDDDNYGLKYDEGEIKELEYLNNSYALIEDGKDIILYDLDTKSTLISYDEVKDYHKKLENNLLIVKQKGKWGVLSLDYMSPILKNEFDFIGLPLSYDEVIPTSKFIALKNSLWYIYDNNSEALNQGLTAPILDFNNKYIITNENKIYDYENNQVNISFNFKDYFLMDDYILLVTMDNKVLVYDDLVNEAIREVTINNYKNIRFEVDNFVINVYLNGTMATSIDLNS